MRYWLLLLILILALFNSGQSSDPPHQIQEPQQTETTPEQKREWTRQILLACHLLAQPRYQDRFKGVQILTRLPTEAEPLITEKLSRVSSLRVKLHIFEALINRKSKVVAKIILQEIRKPHSSNTTAYLVRLLRATPNGWNELAAEYAKPTDDERRPLLEHAYTSFIEAEVREHFLFCLETYDSGYFRSMFDKCWKFGEPGIQVLINIVRGEEERTPYYDLRKGRELASAALIDWRLPPNIKISLLTALAAELSEQETTRWLNNTGRIGSLDNVRYALHALGQKQGSVESDIANSKHYIEQYKKRRIWTLAISALNTLAHKYLSLRDNQKATQTWNESIAIFIDHGEPENRKEAIALAWYNLACVRSLENDPAKAVSALEQALKYGYADFEWMWKDRDLENTWNTEAWNTWITKLSKTEQWRHHIPNREPGALTSLD